MRKEILTPLSEAKTDRIDMTEIYPPAYVRGKIGVNLDTTKRLMDIGGIKNLRLHEEGRKRSVEWNAGLKGQQWIDFDLFVHTDSFARYLGSSGSANSGEEWSRELDKSVRAAIRKCGTKFSTHLGNFPDNLLNIGAESMVPIGVGIPLYADQGLVGITIAAMTLALRGGAEGLIHMMQPSRHSLLLISHLDRAAWLQLRARTTKIIKPISS